jgi:LacI family transcriptional regulator
MADKRKIYTLVIPRFEDIFHSFFAQEIIKGATSAASRIKADILIHIVERNQSNELFENIEVTSPVSDGVVFADIDQDRISLKRVINYSRPCVVLNNSFLEPINCISIDNYKATRRLMEYLIGLGHTRIATICGDLTTEAGKERLKGYNDALNAKGINVDNRYIKKGDFLRTPARRAAERLLDLDNPPTAIFAASDVMALEVLDVAKSRGIKVPNQLSVVGFDDNPLNIYSTVGLTTVRQPILEMARLGVEILDRIVKKQEKTPIQNKLNATLIKRDTCTKI